MACVAEEEARLISIRTKAALAEAKKRGVELGKHGKVLGRESKKRANEFAKEMTSAIKEGIIETIKNNKRISYRSLAELFNKKKLKTEKGGSWHGNTVQRICDRLGLDIHTTT